MINPCRSPSRNLPRFTNRHDATYVCTTVFLLLTSAVSAKQVHGHEPLVFMILRDADIDPKTFSETIRNSLIEERLILTSATLPSQPYAPISRHDFLTPINNSPTSCEDVRKPLSSPRTQHLGARYSCTDPRLLTLLCNFRTVQFLLYLPWYGISIAQRALCNPQTISHHGSH